MKIFDLQCAAGHRFEGWFASGDEFALQRDRGLIGCPTCGGLEVERIPSATRFNTGAPAPASQKAERGEGDPLAIAQKLYSRMLDDLLTRSEDVGAAFPDEARRIHYHEAPERMIRGHATREQHDALLDEGIPVARLPVPTAKRLN